MFNPVAWFIAKRYLFSKKSHSVINLISLISIVAVAIPASALIILLSVSNGLSDFVKKLNDTFDPNIKISLATGASFDYSMPMVQQLEDIDGVQGVTQYLEGDCVIASGDKTAVIVLRGIDTDYVNNFPIEDAIIDGRYNKYNMLMGSGVAYALGYALGLSGEVVVYVPSLKGSSIFGINRQFYSDKIPVTGIFMLDMANDSKYALAPLEFCQKLFSKEGEVSAIGVDVESLEQIDDIKYIIEQIVPEGFIVRDRLEQREVDYAIVQQEKMAVFVMLLFIMIIASLSLVGAGVMMIIEKQQQIYVIGTLGGTEMLKRTIFRYQSLMMTCIGGVLGVLIGVGFSLLQQYFGFIKIDSDVIMIDTYPILLDYGDVVMVFFAIIVVGYLIALLTTSSMMSRSKQKK